MQKQSCPTCNESLLRVETPEKDPLKDDRVQNVIRRISEINRTNLRRYLTALHVEEEQQAFWIDQILQKGERATENQSRHYRRDDWVCRHG